MKRHVALILVVALACAVLLAGCAPKPAQPTPPAQTKKMVVGSEAAYAPFEFVDEKTGGYLGFDIDLIKAIGKEMGYEVQIKNIAWDGLRPALLNKEIDCIISAMSITDERAQVVTFADPYLTIGQVICAKKGSPIKGVADLVSVKVGVQANTTGHYAVQKIEGMKDQNISKFETTPDAFQALMTGSVDAVVADGPVVAFFVKSNPTANVATVGDTFTVEYYGIAMRKEDTALHTLVNQALAKVKASGEYQTIYEKWFGKG